MKLAASGLAIALLLAPVATPSGAPDQSYSPTAGRVFRGASLSRWYPTRWEVRESAVAWHPYPDPVSSGAPLAAGTISGNAGYAVPALGSAYLAMRLPRGTLVTITGPGGSWTARVTDYGPSSWIRPPRVADIALGHWLTICGKPASAGLCAVRVQLGAPVPTAPRPTAPATDSMEEPR